MNQQHTQSTSAVATRHPMRAFRIVLAAMLMALAAVFMAPSAQAHDQLIGTKPEQGSTVKSSPKQITLTFSGELKPIGDLAILKDSSDTVIETTRTIKGTEMTVTPGKQLENGVYSLVTRVVSSDGHPIEQKLGFTVAAAVSNPNPSPTATASASAVPETTTTPEPPATAAPESTEAAAPVSSPIDGIPAIVVWPLVGLVVVGGLLMVIAKTRRK